MKKLYFLPPVITQWIIRLVTKAIFSTLCNLKVRGLENLSGHKAPLIFVANHTSEWDGPLIRTVMPMVSRFGPMFYMSMSKSFYVKSGWRKHIYGGLIFKIVGAYPTFYGLKDYEKSLYNHIKILEDKGSITIFPEGKKTESGDVGNFKPGVIALSHYTNTPIVPAYIKDMYKLNKKAFFSRKRKVEIKFGTPYSIDIPNNLSNDEIISLYKEEAKKLRQSVLELAEKS